MNVLELTTILLLLASVFSIINLRLLKLPQTIGLMVLAIGLSISVLAIGFISPNFLETATSLIQSFDFEVLLIDVMLPFLLFAGAFTAGFGFKFSRWPSVACLGGQRPPGSKSGPDIQVRKFRKVKKGQ